jgi:hypothetical protein
MVDDRFAKYWARQRQARERARASIPAEWVDDKRPEIQLMIDAHVESVVEIESLAEVVQLRPRPLAT